VTSADERGFSLLEMLIATGLTLSVTAGVFGMLNPSHGSFSIGVEMADMQQRLRVGVDTFARDLGMAGAGPYLGGEPAALNTYFPAVLPFRVGVGADPPGTFRTDRITILHAPLATGQTTVPYAVAGRIVGLRSHTYFVKSDPANQTFDLMHYDGTGNPDVPVLEHVVDLTFEYYDETLAPLTAAVLTDGPWRPDEADPNRWDVDLLRIRAIAVTLRVETALPSLRGPAGLLFRNGGTSRGGGRWLPDQEIRLQIAPRNLSLVR
jgi:hypothetical protein